ncbi:MAG TPA: formyltransferase family protein [Candidatus Saccharimonadales bacterium]
MMNKKPRIAILASGSGTTAEALMQSIVRGECNGEVALVISNSADAGVFEKVDALMTKNNLTVEKAYVSSKNFPDNDGAPVEYGRQTRAEEAEILRLLKLHDIDFVALLGYMKLVGSSIVERYGYNSQLSSPFQAQMVNTHPGILPDTKGLYGIHVQEYVLKNNRTAGHCLFAVDTEYDGGPVVAEHRVEVLEGDTPESLFERIKASERATIGSDIDIFLTQHTEES